MRYVGGKSRQAKSISKILLSQNPQTYLEPFLGSAAVASLITPYVKRSILSDLSPDLIYMWRAARDGWEPPKVVTISEYNTLRNEEPSALRGFVGFGVSYNGKWWGGYGAYAISANRDYVDEARRSVLKRGSKLKGSLIVHSDYAAHKIDSTFTVYADPPYKGTLEYGAVRPFNHNRFWRVVTKWSLLGAKVFVSEFTAPKGWVSVLENERISTIHHEFSTLSRTEKLFMWKG